MDVSNHAAQRYAERVLNFKCKEDEELTYDAICALKRMVYVMLKPFNGVIMAQRRGKIMLDDFVYVFEDSVILSVIPREKE